jgi:hypothetical protein
MAPSTAEREIRLLRSHKQPIQLLDSQAISELGITITPSYDQENDALTFDFGFDEPTFDLPEPDGMMIWRIGRQSDSVTGFTIVGAQEKGISGISIQFIARRKEDIERNLRKNPLALASGRATRALVEGVVVRAHAEEIQMEQPDERDTFFEEVETRLKAFVSV